MLGCWCLETTVRSLHTTVVQFYDPLNRMIDHTLAEAKLGRGHRLLASGGAESDSCA